MDEKQRLDEKQRANAASFGQAAAAYDRGRPSYPRDAVDWLLPRHARQVVDLGAGTGKLTGLLAARGLEVTAVEPSDGMRAQLVAALPGIPALAGTAEQLPLPDHSVDVVLVAQAWHWVDPALAVPEVARVLRPGGRLGLLWNVRDERVGWVAALGRLLSRAGGAMESTSVTDLGPQFGSVETFGTDWAQEMTAERLIDLVTSRSYVITATNTERVALLSRVRALLASDPELVGGNSFSLPYRTQCFRADLLSS